MRRSGVAAVAAWRVEIGTDSWTARSTCRRTGTPRRSGTRGLADGAELVAAIVHHAPPAAALVAVAS
jgi:hypothetical protein